MKKPQARSRRTKRTINKKRRDRTVIAKKKFLDAFGRHKGNVTKACLASRVGRATYYEWLKEDLIFKQTIDVAFEAIVDHVEDKLHQLIDRLEPSAVYFFLKTRGKARGYVERQELRGSLNLTRMSLTDYERSLKESQADAGR